MTEHQLGDAPIEDAHRENMTEIARALDRMFNGDDRGQARKTGFVLLVFPFGDTFDGRCNYISNGAARNDIVTLFKEQIARFEGMAEPQPGHA
jgi:hypothetical protein